MEPLRYFYSTDGTDSHGPVDEAELRLLLQGGRIGSQSFLCREGETTWEPLNPEALHPAEPDLPTEKSGIPIMVLLMGAGIVALVVLLALMPGPQAAKSDVPAVAAEGSKETSEDLKVPATAKYDGRIPVILRGQLKKMQDGTFGDRSYAARFVRALITVGNELPDKIEAGRKKEAGCQFAVQSDANPAALATQIDNLEDLRDTQTDVVDYLQNFDQHFSDCLTGNAIPPFIQPQLSDLVDRRLNIDLHLSLWQAKLDLTRDDIARLDFLQKNAGHWTLKDRKVVFTDATLRTAHEQLLDAVRADLQKISKIQDDLLQRQHDVVT